MADLGYTVTEITERLSFPTPKKRVAETVWAHYLEKGIILPNAPEKDDSILKVRFVKDQDPFGKVSMRRVLEKVPRPQVEYLPIDFGKQRYQDEASFLKRLGTLTERERQYVLDLPWPLGTVWHVKNETITEILRKL